MFKLLHAARLTSIGSRIAISMSALMILAVGVVGWFGYAQQEELGAASVEVRLKEAYDRVQEELKARERVGLLLSYDLANYPGVAEHMEQKDREWLLKNLMARHKATAELSGFNLSNVHMAPGTAFVRWHNPDVWGDDLRSRRQSVVQAIQTGKPQVGLEPGRDSLAMFAVVPIRLGDRIIGVADTGTAIGKPLADDLKKRLRIDIAFHIFGNGKFETAAGTIAGKSLLSTEDLKAAMSERLAPHAVQVGDHQAAVTAAPLINFAGNPIGAIEIVLDVTDMAARADRSLYVFAGAAAAAVLLGLIVSLLLARGIGRPIREITRTMGGLADGNLDLAVPHGARRDEIGLMARAIEVFRKGLVERRTLESEAARQRNEAEEMRRRNEAERQQADAHRMQLEREAAEQRELADAERLQAEEERRANAEAQAKAAQEQATAMKALAAGLARLAEGDLTVRMNEGFTEAYRRIKDDFNTTMDRLHQTIKELADTTREVSNAAAEIATSTTDLSQRTEEQAAGLEETSASMEEIAATVKKNAENAQHANQLTAGTREVADKGGQVVANAVEAMSRIEDSSRKISDIIGVIDEIARQTNLLALNAAVEAARAGDAGRGFAVVASEVRSLAQRSSQAAKDIKDLITNSNVQVKEGVDLVNRAGTSLGEIVESIKSVAGIVADIANASMEQATGIEQVNKALTQMDEVTQQNSALVEENAATAKTLETQSAAMNERVSFFRLEGAAAPAIVRPGFERAPSARALAPKRGGVVGRMQSALATALKQDEDWQEF